MLLELCRDVLRGNMDRGLAPAFQLFLAEADMFHPHFQMLLFFHHNHQAVPSRKLLFKPLQSFQRFNQKESSGVFAQH
jgi:hypothetical protein